MIDAIYQYPFRLREPKRTDLAGGRLPKWLRQQAKEKAKREDVTFSQLMRRALRRELGQSKGSR